MNLAVCINHYKTHPCVLRFFPPSRHSCVLLHQKKQTEYLTRSNMLGRALKFQRKDSVKSYMTEPKFWQCAAVLVAC